VAVNRAVELVLAGLQVSDRLRDPALRDRVARHLDAVPFDLDGVRQVGRVVHDDGDLACLRGQRALVELERAPGVGRDLQRLPAAPAAGVLLRRAASGVPAGAGVAATTARATVVVIAAPGDRDGECTEEGDEGEGAHVPVYAPSGGGVQ
jgi:hypothetical protein